MAFEVIFELDEQRVSKFQIIAQVQHRALSAKIRFIFILLLHLMLVELVLLLRGWAICAVVVCISA